jgi:hypothetical protein
MFEAHSDGLEAFKNTVLEHRTPAKPRSSILFGSASKGDDSQGHSESSQANTTSTSAAPGTAQPAAKGDSVGSETEHTAKDAKAVEAVLSPSALRHGGRRSSARPTQHEYQREQETQGADTTASRALFFLQNVDPQRFTTAIVGLNAGLVAVVATLKVQFAKTITLGAALSKAIDGPAKTFLTPLVTAVLPKPYKKWADVLVTYSVKSFAISIAWTLRRVMSSFHSAIRGGLMFSTNLLSYLRDMGYISKAQSESYFVPYLDKILGYTLALLGLWFQLSYGFALPFPLNVILFPFTVLEYALVWMVNNSHYILGHYT